MKAEQKYYVKKKVKQGKDFVLKDFEIDIYNDIKNEKGFSLGQLIDQLQTVILKQQRQLDKIDKFIRTIGGQFNEEN
jgi:hypothetical protein